MEIAKLNLYLVVKITTEKVKNLGIKVSYKIKQTLEHLLKNQKDTTESL